MASSYVSPVSIHNPATGTSPPATWGDTVNDDLDFIVQDRPAARVYNSANFSVANAAWTAVTFNSERYDTTNMHSVASNTSRLTIGVTGLYTIGGCLDWAASAAGTRRDLAVFIDGSSANAIVVASHVNPTAYAIRLNVACEYYLSSGSYIELMAYQDSGGALNALNSGKYSPEFWCRWVGV